MDDYRTVIPPFLPTDLAAHLRMPIATVMERVRAAGRLAHRQANERFEVAYSAFLESLAGDEVRAHAQLERLRKAAERAALPRAVGERRAPG